MCKEDGQIKGYRESTQDIEILGWCSAGSVLPHWKKMPL